MELIIESAQDAATDAAAQELRDEVFGVEWGVALPRLACVPADRKFTVVARTAAGAQPVAALTAIETTGDDILHRRYGISFGPTSSARYTQLAVRAGFRGQNLPVRLIFEVHRRFTAPKKIQYTWLLFNAERAANSALCRVLGYEASQQRLLTEYGWSRVLVRDETQTHIASHIAALTAVDKYQPAISF